MKKIILIVFILSIVIAGLSSCKGSQDCPAYGKTKVENPEKQA